MTQPIWVRRVLVDFIHDQVLEIAGGAKGLRDENLLDSALVRPVHLYVHSEPDMMVRLAQDHMNRLKAAEHFRSWSKQL